MLGRWHWDSGTRSARQAASDVWGLPLARAGCLLSAGPPTAVLCAGAHKIQSHNHRHPWEGQSSTVGGVRGRVPGSGWGEGLAQSCVGAVVRQWVGLPHAPGPWAQVWLWPGEDAKAMDGRWQVAKCGRGLWHGEPSGALGGVRGPCLTSRPRQSLCRCGPTSKAMGWVMDYGLFRGRQMAAHGLLSAAVGDTDVPSAPGPPVNPEMRCCSPAGARELEWPELHFNFKKANHKVVCTARPRAHSETSFLTLPTLTVPVLQELPGPT